MTIFRLVLTLIILTGASAMTCASDWPQYRGPNRDGVSFETGLLKVWPKSGPQLLWTYDQSGLGYSGPAIVGNRLFACGGRGADEFLHCLDISGTSPKELWSAKIGPLFQWTGNQWNKGPNVTPTFADGFVYALGGQGDLICVSANDGKEVWRISLPRDLGGEVNPIGGGAAEPTPLGWGYANAPLIDGDQLIIAPGGPKGLLAALDRKTGKVLWRSREITEQTSYASPIVVEVGGIRQYVQVTNAGMVGILAKDGNKLWSYIRQPAYDDVVIATPVFHDNHVFSTVGFAQGCDLVKLSASGTSITAEKVFSNKSIENRDGGVVLVDGHLYGHSENVGWFCQEFRTGKTVWSEKRKLGRGSIAYADGRLYCVAEEGGMVALIEATPKGWTEHGRFQLPRASNQRQPSGRLWTHPVVANGRLYVRDQELLFCFNVKQ